MYRPSPDWRKIFGLHGHTSLGANGITVIVRQRLVGGRGPMQDTEELPALKWEVMGMSLHTRLRHRSNSENRWWEMSAFK